MKKILCVLMISLLITSNQLCLVYANENIINNETQVVCYECDGGTHYSVFSTDKTVSITLENANNCIVEIRYKNNDSTIYQWVIDISDLYYEGTNAGEFCSMMISLAEQNFSNAAEVTIFEYSTDYSYGNMARSSAVADLKSDLAQLVGSYEYNESLRYSDVRSGVTFSVFESMGFYINQYNGYYWNGIMTVGSVITNILGLVPTTQLVSSLCGIFNVANSVYSYVSAGGIKDYYCLAQNVRATKLGYGQNPLTYTEKRITFHGYENANLNNSSRAFVNPDSRETIYTDNVTYFYSYPSQIDRAYQVYMQ